MSRYPTKKKSIEKSTLTIMNGQGLESLVEILFYCSFCSIGIIPEYRSSLLLIIFSIAVFIKAFVRKEPFLLNKNFLWVSVLYIPSFFNLFIEPSFKEAIFDLQQKLPFLILPVVMSQFNPSKSILRNALLYFSFATVGLCLWTFRYGNFSAFFSDAIFDDFVINKAVLGMYSAMCIVIIYENRLMDVWLKLLLGTFLVVFNFLVLTKLIMLVSMLILCYILYVKTNNHLAKWGTQFAVLVFFFLGTVSIVMLGKDGTKKAYQNIKEYVQINMQTRVEVWDCASKVGKAKFFGLGTNQTQLELNQCYETYYPESITAKAHLNPHNQYLASYLYYGFFGLFCLLLFSFVVLRKGYQYHSLLLNSFLFIFLSYNLLESNFQVYRSLTFTVWMYVVLLNKEEINYNEGMKE